ncbi:MAG: hypothetical protein Ta2G_04730 [Termitinemataceae bacterium]|nr:MAG: hypothetical protein Ta2G_04730 [Termitinemataceae bacterium]
MFVDDIQCDNLFFAIIVRSPSASGQLISIQCDNLSDDYTLITAKDIPGHNALSDSEFPLIADKYVSYIGQPVGLITGPSYEHLENLIPSCKIVIEEKHSILDMNEPLSYAYATKTLDVDVGTVKDGTGENEDEEIIVEGIYSTSVQAHHPSETGAALVFIEDDFVTIYSATQCVSHLRKSVCGALNIDEKNIMVNEVDLGIHYDSKLWYSSFISVLAAVCAFKIKKNVKLVTTREEDFLYAPKRIATEASYKSVVNANGVIKKTDIEIKANFGSAQFYSEKIIDEIMTAAIGTVKLGNLNLKCSAMFSNLPPSSTFAGYGASQGTFLLERHLAAIADKLRYEPFELRGKIMQKKRSKRLADINTTVPIETVFTKIHNSLTRKSDFKRKWASYEMLRHTAHSEEKIEPLRGIAMTSVKSYAACVVELEINPLNYKPMIKGIWIDICSENAQNKYEVKYLMMQTILCAIGWACTEDIKYIDGKIKINKNCFEYIQNAIEFENVHVDFIEAVEENKIRSTEVSEPALNYEELTFSLFTPSFIQAISQAVDYNFTSLPVTVVDIWKALRKIKSEKQNGETEK